MFKKNEHTCEVKYILKSKCLKFLASGMNRINIAQNIFLLKCSQFTSCVGVWYFPGSKSIYILLIAFKRTHMKNP